MIDLMNFARRLKRRLTHTQLVDLSRLHELEERRILGRIFSTLNIQGVVDIGANRGGFALNAMRAKSKPIPIVCVEPNEVAIWEFKKKMAANKLISVLHVAVSDKEADGVLHVTANDEFSSLKIPKPQAGAFKNKVAVKEKIAIKMLTLDSLIEYTFPEGDSQDLLVKLDTQGMDYEILDRSGKVGRRASCIISEIEFSSLLYGSQRSWVDHVHMVEAKGFRLAAIYASNAGHFPDLHDMNAVFVNQSVVPGPVPNMASR
jgi:FkbM family methyltransferase